MLDRGNALISASGLHHSSCHCKAPAFVLGRQPYRSSDMVELLICGLLNVTGSEDARVPFLLSRAGKTLLASGSEESRHCSTSRPGASQTRVFKQTSEMDLLVQ